MPNMNAALMKIATGTAALLLVLTSCNKELNGPNVTDGPGTFKATCPQQTVPITSLANIAGPPTVPTGQLNSVYKLCFPAPACGSFQNFTYDVLVGSAMVTPGAGPLHVNNYPNVTYSEQVAMINYFLNLANSMAPTCSGTTKKVVKGLKFYRDAFVVDGINCYATYACCAGAPN